MACMGPDKNISDQNAEKAFKEIMELLEHKYLIERPEKEYLPKGFAKKMQKEWDEQAQKLLEDLKELFWTSDAASW